MRNPLTRSATRLTSASSVEPSSPKSSERPGSIRARSPLSGHGLAFILLAAPGHGNETPNISATFATVFYGGNGTPKAIAKPSSSEGKQPACIGYVPAVTHKGDLDDAISVQRATRTRMPAQTEARSYVRAVYRPASKDLRAETS